MQPIVYGLETEFGDRIVFEYRDAGPPAGKAVMRTYGLRGHPSYIIFDPDGTLVWSYTGAVAADVLAAQIERSLRPAN